MQSATEAWSRRLVLHWAHATDPGDPERPVDQRLGVLGRSGQDGTEARTRRLDPAGPTPPLAATRIWKLERFGWDPPNGRGHPVTDARPRRPVPNGPWSSVAAMDAQLRRLELSGPMPPVATTRMIKPGGQVTKDHGPASSDPDGSPDSRLGHGTKPRPTATRNIRDRWTMD